MSYQYPPPQDPQQQPYGQQPQQPYGQQPYGQGPYQQQQPYQAYAPGPPPPKKRGPWFYIILSVCLVFGLCCSGALGFFVWIALQPEPGVKMANQMDAYAIEYLQANGMLNEHEEVVAYFDATFSMDGTEAAILTNQRVMYHKDGRTTEIALADVEDVEHSDQGIIGDVIEITSTEGDYLKVEIPALNDGRVFLRALQKQVELVRTQLEGSGARLETDEDLTGEMLPGKPNPFSPEH